VAPEPDVVPIAMPRHDPAPPRRFAPIASIEPDDSEPAPVEHHQARGHHSEPEPAYEESAAPGRRIADPEVGMPLDDDDLDVPAFIRRKVD
jgi:hypothetical protein